MRRSKGGDQGDVWVSGQQFRQMDCGRGMFEEEMISSVFAM